jgi:hypothetical protein
VDSPRLNLNQQRSAGTCVRYRTEFYFARRVIVRSKEDIREVEYRVYTVGIDGHVTGFEPLVRADDAEAVAKTIDRSSLPSAASMTESAFASARLNAVSPGAHRRSPKM